MLIKGEFSCILMRKLDSQVFNICWKYLEIVGYKNNPYVVLDYDTDSCSIRCHKDRSGEDGKSLGTLVVSSKGVLIDSKIDSNLKEYLERELGKKKIKLIELEDKKLETI